MDIKTLKNLKKAGFPQYTKGHHGIANDGMYADPTLDEMFDAFNASEFVFTRKNYSSRLLGADSMVEGWYVLVWVGNESYYGYGEDMTMALANAYLVMQNSKEWPQVGNTFYRLNSTGRVIEATWKNSVKQNAIREFMGIYKTKKEVEKAREKVRDLLADK